MSNSLSLPPKELQDAIKHLHKLLCKVKPKPSYPILDVIVKLDVVELRLVGMSRLIKAQHKKIFSFKIPFNIFYTEALGNDSLEFTATITDGSIQIENRVINSPNIELIHPENLQPIDLSINPSIMDILALRHKYSQEELKSKNYFYILLKQEEILEDDISTCARTLSKYGIKKSSLNKMISENIKRHSSGME